MDKRKSKPKVSVVMPVYNNGHLLPNAINSIVNQTFKDWELVIVDDGSTEDIEKIVKNFSWDDQRIIYFKKIHSGIVDSRNYGNGMARADIVAMQDSDDLSLPDRLEKSLEEMHKTGADVLYHGLYKNMWEKGLQCINREYLPAKCFNKYTLLKSQYIPGVCLFRKRCWEKKPFRKETEFAFDWAMHLDWAFSGFTYRALNIGLYEYVRHDKSASAEYEKNGKRQAHIEVIKGIMEKEYGIKT